MLTQRCTIHADAEIRKVYINVLKELQHSRYADRFTEWVISDSPDGIGQVAHVTHEDV
jgi:hypothetical protein